MRTQNDAPWSVKRGLRAKTTTVTLLRAVIGTGAIGIALVTAGCIDQAISAGIDSGMRASALGANPKTYSELKLSLTAPAEGSGRLIVYFPGGGPTGMNAYGVTEVCTIDENAYSLLGATFWYVDLPVGKHKMTIDGVAGIKGLRYGKNVAEVELANGDTKFCRINMSNSGGIDLIEGGLAHSFTLTIVDANAAEGEMAKLPFFPKFQLNRTVK